MSLSFHWANRHFHGLRRHTVSGVDSPKSLLTLTVVPQVVGPSRQPSGVAMEGIRTWMRLISPTDLLERRAERAAHLQELQAAAREAYRKEVRAEIAQKIKLTKVPWAAWHCSCVHSRASLDMTIKIHKGGPCPRHPNTALRE